MEALQQKAKELIESGKAGVVIGYAGGTGNRVRPAFVRTAAETLSLIWDQRCKQNLSVYLGKPEVRKMGKPALVASPGAVRSVIQLIAEHQYASSDLIVLARDGEAIVALEENTALEQYVASHPETFPPPLAARIASLAAMSTQERYAFWQEELSRCFKCYACRAACPLCYCERCITDVNQPQWVCVAPHALGVLEWHLNRAMHMAGRCVQCGACSQACPAGIPVGLLTIEAARIAREEFGHAAGMLCDAPAALSSFTVEDKEAFIQ